MKYILPNKKRFIKGVEIDGFKIKVSQAGVKLNQYSQLSG